MVSGVSVQVSGLRTWWPAVWHLTPLYSWHLYRWKKTDKINIGYIN